jgi:hypothetical protein
MTQPILRLALVEDDLNMRMSINGTMILTGENKQSQSHFVHEKFQTHWSGTETETPTNPVTKGAFTRVPQVDQRG